MQQQQQCSCLAELQVAWQQLVQQMQGRSAAEPPGAVQQPTACKPAAPPYLALPRLLYLQVTLPYDPALHAHLVEHNVEVRALNTGRQMELVHSVAKAATPFALAAFLISVLTLWPTFTTKLDQCVALGCRVLCDVRLGMAGCTVRPSSWCSSHVEQQQVHDCSQ